jgi:hypothetical protein
MSRPESKQLTKLAKNSMKRFTQHNVAMNRGALTDPSFIGSFKRPPIKKEATKKNTNGLVQKTSDEKGGIVQKTSDEKEDIV